MADFHQNGRLATLHNLRARDEAELFGELSALTRRRPVTLILPSLFSELRGPALEKIVAEIASVDFVDHVVIGLDAADRDEYVEALGFFSRFKQPHTVLWNDGPRLQAVNAALAEQGLAPPERGKGCNVWYCIGYALAQGGAFAIAVHDCDIVTYGRGLLARLIYPLVNPSFSYQFCKGFYPRHADGKLNGRVCRLLVTPLLLALEKTIGAREYIDYLKGFRYPLSGEFAMRTSILPDMRIPSDWGLEIGTLSEAWRNLSPSAVCQVELADVYDHKHQPLSEEDPAKGLSRMSVDICKALFRKLATDGSVFSAETFRTLKATYYRIALDLIETYANDARMNGLSLDRHSEERAVELFARNIVEAGHTFLENPMETPFLPNWQRVEAAMPDVFERLKQAVREDTAEFGEAVSGDS